MRQRRDRVTFRDAIARKIDTQTKNTGTGHQRYRDERVKTVTTLCKNGTGHIRDRDKIETTVTTALNVSDCWVTSKLANK